MRKIINHLPYSLQLGVETLPGATAVLRPTLEIIIKRIVSSAFHAWNSAKMAACECC